MTFALVKEMEAEVLRELADLGDVQTHPVTGREARAGLVPAVQQQLDGMVVTPTTAIAPSIQPWPKDRYGQIRAVRDLVAARPGTYTASEIAGAFKSASQAAVRRHLDMLERIGVLVGYDDERGRRWHAGAV